VPGQRSLDAGAGLFPRNTSLRVRLELRLAPIELVTLILRERKNLVLVGKRLPKRLSELDPLLNTELEGLGEQFVFHGPIMSVSRLRLLQAEGSMTSSEGCTLQVDATGPIERAEAQLRRCHTQEPFMTTLTLELPEEVFSALR